MKNNRPRRGPGIPFEKAKDFKSSIRRLFSELGSFKILIFSSLILACISAVLSISAPNRLSKLTDEISKGLIINTNNMETLTKKVTTSMQKEMPNVLLMKVTKENIISIMLDSSISDYDKTKLKSMNEKNSYEVIKKLSDNTLNKLFDDTNYKGVLVTKEDKISMLKNNNIPNKLDNVLFDEIVIDKVKISSSDQVSFLRVLSTIDKNEKNTKVYSKLDTMPKSIKKVIEPNMNITKIKKITLYLIIIYVISALFNFIQSLSMTTVSNKFAKKLRKNISKKINKLPLKYFDRNQTGDILSRVTNDVDTIAQSMNQSLASLVTSTTLLLGSLIMMFYTNYILAFTAIISSLFGFIFMFIVLGKSQKYFKARQDELGNLNSHIEEIYSGLNVVKVYNGKKSANDKFDEYNKKVYIANKKSQFLSGLMMPMMGFVGNLGYVAVCVVGAVLTKNEIITFGVIVAFITYVRLFTQPMSQIAQAMTSIQTTAAASERVFEFLDEEEIPSEEEIKEKIDVSKIKGNIEFDNVVFTYDGNDKPTINNFSAKVKHGEKIAIVGPTGAGKTTMVNLLMKFYDITEGDIRIDGVSIKNIKRQTIHDMFTMVLQDTWMFDGTIKENIVYNKTATDEKIKEVCKKVGLHHFIKTLPKGYDSSSDNDNISQGQKQLLTIARAMIDNAPFLILDEATSNVDTRTEELVQTAMDELAKNKTSFIIAHRLSTIKNANLILVMKDGNIIEQGNHDELIKKNGFYAELYNSQFEL